MGRAFDDRMARQNGRLDKLEERIGQARVALAETDGRIGTIKTGMEGEIKLVYEMLARLGEKIERIEANTSKEQNAKRTWRIALVAALPGLISVIIKLTEVLTGG